MPDMLGKDAEGKDIRLSDFPGKKFIIYFYPKDNTPGCTAEAVSLRDNYETLLKMGYQVIGVSKERRSVPRCSGQGGTLEASKEERGAGKCLECNKKDCLYRRKTI